MHHVFLDGSSGMNLMRQFARALDGDETALAPSDEVPAALHSRFTPEVASPRAAVDVLGAVRAERAGQPAPAVFPFHDRHAQTTIPRHDLLVVSGDALEALLARAKAAGATVTGMVDAAFLESAADLFDDDEPRWICLASATDLRHRVEPPLPFDDMQLAIGMVATPYLVSGATHDTLPRDIADQIAREVARGESHLFYRFAPHRDLPADGRGARLVRHVGGLDAAEHHHQQRRADGRHGRSAVAPPYHRDHGARPQSGLLQRRDDVPRRDGADGLDRHRQAAAGEGRPVRRRAHDPPRREVRTDDDVRALEPVSRVNPVNLAWR